MEKSDSEKPHSDKNSGNNLVRILVIVFIGIPVLVELMTLFNLINVNLWGDEPEAVDPTTQTAEVRQFVEGDTLFTDSQYPLLINVMRIKVSTQDWEFNLGLSPVRVSSQQHAEITIDSLRLRSGQILKTNKIFSGSVDKPQGSELQASWELPSGDIPTEMYMSLKYPSADTSVITHRKFELGNLPVRYTRTEN